MKIMMILNDSNYAWYLRREVLQGFKEAGHTVSLVCEVLSYKEELEKMGCSLVHVDMQRRGKNPFSDILLLMKYHRILRNQRPDVVCSCNIKPNVYAGFACRLLGIPYIVNITGLGTPLEVPGPLQTLTVGLYKIGVKGANCVFFQNEENLKFFCDRKMLGKNTRAELLPGSGVNLQSHPVQKYPEGEKNHFLFAARVMKEKGIDQFLAAARRFHGENAVFEICGACDDPQYLKILQQAHEKGIVIYHGLQKDMNPFYQRCSCFLYPSYYPEGMSNVLLEAAASGRPVIAADRSGCRETVDDGVSGYIVPVQDEQAVIEAVEKFLTLSWEERSQMGLAGRKKMEREFDRRFVVQKYMEALEYCHATVK